MKKKLLFLLIFYCFLNIFSPNANAQAQFSNYPLNVIVELTGVSHNISDGVGTPEIVYQIGNEVIILDGVAAGSIYNINNALLTTQTLSCYDLNNSFGYAFLPPFTGEEDDCTEITIGCDGFSVTPDCLGDDYCIANVVHGIDVFNVSFGQPGIYDYTANYSADGISDAYQLHLRITIIPDTSQPSCDYCEMITELDRYQCANNQTDSGNALADAYVNISENFSFAPVYTVTVKSSVGATFPYGTSVNLQGSNPVPFIFKVVQDQPWQITMETDYGCEFSFYGVFDLPELDFIGLNAAYCMTDPPNYIYDAATFYPGNPTGPGSVAVPGQYFGVGIADNGNGSAVFDPFDAGTGVHLITYLITDYGGVSGNPEYVSCEMQKDAIVNVYPVFSPSFVAPPTMCTSNFPVFLELNDISQTLNEFAALENQFDPFNIIAEGDAYIKWQGTGVSQINDGNGSAIFDPNLAGVGVHNIQVSVGYPSCRNTYNLNIEVFECTSNLRISAALEGAFDSNTNLMRTDLNDANLLPLSQPFSVSPWNYNGNESISNIPNDVVDWLLVELRSAANTSQIVERKAAFLLKNGDIVDIDSSVDGVEFNYLNANDSYYIVLRHRNHLDIVSATTQELDMNNELTYSFVSSANQALGIAQLTEISTGIYGLRAGDSNADGKIDDYDVNVYFAESSLLNQSLRSDNDMNTTVTVKDFNLWLSNYGTVGVAPVRY